MDIIMAVDFGDARTGLAVTDSAGMMAHGAGCIEGVGFKKVAAAVAEKAKKRSVALIVVGNPINMNGTEGPRSQKCRDFAETVAELSGIPTVMQDERLTTVSAHRFLSDSGVAGRKHKKHVDELSATLILESYLERLKSAGDTAK